MSYPEPCVGAVILNEKDEIFLMRSPHWEGQYIIPGGHVEIGETMEAALKREIMEETNMTVDVLGLMAIFDGIKPKTYHEEKHLILIDFLCKKTGGDIVLQEEEATEYIWIKPEDAASLPDILDTTEELIERWLQNGKRLL